MIDTKFLWDERELHFLLFEQFRVHMLESESQRYAGWDKAAITELVSKAMVFAERIGKHYKQSDREGCALNADGTIRIPEAYQQFWFEYVSQWVKGPAGKAISAAPTLVGNIVSELFMGANPCFMIYGGFSRPAAQLIAETGTEAQKSTYLRRLMEYTWDACFCVTETEAGSDLSAMKTYATEVEEGVFEVVGDKKFISAGMHSLTENTVYVVLGRIRSGQDEPGISCFLVPRYWLESDGTLADNHVRCVKVEEKMGLKACANTHLVFGVDGKTRAHLLGDRGGIGLLQAQVIMQSARLSTGLFGLGMASSAYLHALAFSRRRIQGRRFDENSNLSSPQVAIVEHLDVKRMLLEMKSKVEGCRGLIARYGHHSAQAAILESDPAGDRSTLQRHRRLMQFYTPLIKAYISDQSWRVCELAIQVHGGVGYLQDYPVEQYARDVKILSIWEGTNYIQAQDLIREKLRFGKNSPVLKYLTEDMEKFQAQRADYPQLAEEFSAVESAFKDFQSTIHIVSGMVSEGESLRISQYFCDILAMTAEVMVAWLLLEAAVAAEFARQNTHCSEADAAFYAGKRQSAAFYIHNILPNVAKTHRIVSSHRLSAIHMDQRDFGCEIAV